MKAQGTNVDTKEHRRQLVRLLRLAYSGELAAAYAYSGHWRSLRDPQERAQVQKIEREEWEHRATVGEMLKALNEKPQAWRELMMATIGRSVALACFLIGYFLPMYFAGKLEHANVMEYEGAAEHAKHLGLERFIPELHRMSATEREHEVFFSNASSRHPLLPLVKAVFHWDPNEVLALEANRSGKSTTI
jgi:demethoxyubiquinone hydroxylase (CLK1/Coq7/Cat5 family)